VASSLISGPQFDLRKNATFDFVGSKARNQLVDLFPNLPLEAVFIEAKINAEKELKNSMANKIEKFRGGASTITGVAAGELRSASQRAGAPLGRTDLQKQFGKIRGASGYIPNFAGGALDEAVAREQAAGVPINQIRINQSGKLRNAQNPMGLAVTNTRDEPTGAIPNFAKGESGGFGGGAALTAIFAVQALAGLAGSFVEGDEKLQKLINVISTTITVLSTLSLLGPSIQGLRGKLDNFASSLPRTVTATGASGKTRQFAAPSRLAGAARFGSRALALAGPVGIAASIIVPLALEMGLFKDKTKEAAKAVEAYKNDLEALSDVEKKNAVTVLENQLRGLQALKAEQ